MSVAPELNVGACPLCGKVVTKKAIRLYNGWVCSKCAAAFANRRQFAFLLDNLILFLFSVFVGIFLTTSYPVIGAALLAPVFSIWDILFRIVENVMFMAKDGFRGKTPGRWLTGVTVLDEQTREPIGFLQSMKRNLCLLVPFSVLIIAFRMMKGHRWGDRWAGTRVIWDKYRHQFPFEDRGAICRKCGYNLFGNESGVCPECGETVPPEATLPLVARPV